MKKLLFSDRVVLYKLRYRYIKDNQVCIQFLVNYMYRKIYYISNIRVTRSRDRQQLCKGQ